jgi:hypothetical protein
LSAHPQTAPSPALVAALRLVLRPLAKVMLAHGITCPFVTELLKRVMVEVAGGDTQAGAKPQTASRLSLVTGVHRKDVKRLLQDAAADPHAAPAVVSLGAQLVGLWLSSPLYLDEEGRPRPLPRFASEGGDASFERLVSSVNTDIRSRAVLDEWLRLGVAHLDDQQRVCLNVEAFIPEKGFDEKAYYFGHNLHDHAAAAGHNLAGQTPPFLERSVHYDALSAESIGELAADAEKLGMEALLALNKRAIELEKRDADSDAPRQRMNFGIYFYSEPAAASAAPSDKRSS